MGACGATHDRIAEPMVIHTSTLNPHFSTVNSAARKPSGNSPSGLAPREATSSNR